MSADYAVIDHQFTDTKMTVVDGKILYENGTFTTVDAGEIYAHANRLAM